MWLKILPFKKQKSQIKKLQCKCNEEENMTQKGHSQL